MLCRAVPAQVEIARLRNVVESVERHKADVIAMNAALRDKVVAMEATTSAATAVSSQSSSVVADLQTRLEAAHAGLRDMAKLLGEYVPALD